MLVCSDPCDRQNDVIAYFDRGVLPRDDQATSGHYQFRHDSFIMGAQKVLLTSCPGRMIIHLISNQERYILDMLALPDTSRKPHVGHSSEMYTCGPRTRYNHC